MPASLTELQREYLKYVQDYVYQNEDAPRLEEIAEHFQVSSTTAHNHLKKLRNKSYLTFDRTSESGYFIRLLENAGKSEKIVEAPIMGEVNRYGEIEFYGLLEHIAKITNIKDTENVNDLNKIGRIPILTYSDNPLDIAAYMVVEDIPSVSMQINDVILVDHERQPQAGDICLFSHNEGFILMRVVSKTFDKDTPWPKMAQEYPIPEAFTHPEHEQELFWYPMAMDAETEGYFLKLMQLEQWVWIPLPHELALGTVIRLIRTMYFEETSE